MRKNFKWLLALVAMVASVNLMAGVTDLSESLDLTTKSVGQNNYNTSTIYGDWTIVNGANNNKGWAYFKMGGKKETISTNNPCYIYYSANSGVSSQVDSITVSIAAGSLSKDDMSVNSWGVYVYSDKAMKTQIDYVAGGTITKNAATFGFKPSAGKTWAAGSYYKVSWDLANTTSTNGIVCVDKVTLHSISATPDPVLLSIAISGTPTKTTYEAGETFDPAGLVVTGTYDIKNPEVITKGIEWAITPSGALTAGTTSVSVTAKVGEVTSEAYQVNGLTVNAIEGDRLTLASTGVSGSAYTEWSGKTGSEGVAVYAGKCAGGNSSIQLNTTNPQGLVSTTSGGLIRKVKVDWNSNTSSTGNRSIDIYGSNTAYTGSGDIYDTEKQGTKLGSIVCGTSTELVVEGDYEYVGVRAIGGALYINSITFVWSAPAPATLDSLVIKGKAEKMEYEVGEAFDPAGLEVWGIYTKTVKGDSTSQIKSGFEWSIDPETFAEVSENASVTVKAKFNKVESKPQTITGIVVTVKEVTYANTYTSNVELTAEGGTSASAAKIVVAKGDTVDGIKAGTGSIKGACVVTIPAATKTLHFHAAAWNKEVDTLDVNGTKYTLVADAGVSGNSPFTLQNDPETKDYFTFDPKGATSITFKIAGGFRFVLFGVNAELEEGVVAAPFFTPTESEFDGSVEISLSCETEGADIYFTLDGTTPEVGKSTSYEGPFTLTKTTTIKAIAEKGGKTSEVAEKTYTKIPVFESLEALVTNLPATDKNVTVIVTITEAKIDSFYVTSQKQTNGVYVTAASTAVELYEYNVPEAWEVGGTLSATTLKAQWGLFKGTAELQKWNNGWTVFNYTAPQPTGINNVNANAKATKAIVNGQIVIIRDNKTYNVLGF